MLWPSTVCVTGERCADGRVSVPLSNAYAFVSALELLP